MVETVTISAVDFTCSTRDTYPLILAADRLQERTHDEQQQQQRDRVSLSEQGPLTVVRQQQHQQRQQQQQHQHNGRQQGRRDEHPG